MASSTNQSTFDADVIIVGAGPIGLTMAAALRHHGVRCRLLEEQNKPKPNSRANNVWARPQELLASIGIREAIAENAYRIDKVDTLLNGQPIDPVELDHVASPYPQVLYSGQDVIETTLSGLVAERGCPVERSRKVVGIEQDDDGVVVTVVEPAEQKDGPDGPPERLRCRYLVGADGTKGTVRKVVDLDFEAEGFEHRANRQVDAKLAWRRPTDPNHLWFFYYHNGFGGVLPVWGGYHRLFFLEDDAGLPDRDPTLAEMQEVARRVTGDDTVTLSDPIWFSQSRFKHGVSPHFRQGRVFLVGDAGHTSLPIGGQGMNSGFHDAVSLAWRLAMTLAGKAEAAVLQSYDEERQGEHARLSEQQAKGFRRVAYRGPVIDLALDIGTKLLPNVGSLIQGTDDLQQIAVSYPKSALNEDHLVGLRQLVRAHLPRPGDRAPDAEVTDGHGRTTSLFEHIYNPDGRSWGWCLLAFDGRDAQSGPHLLAALDAVAGWAWVRPRMILAATIDPAVEASPAVKLSDLAGHAHGAYGMNDLPALLLVRPDGHIAFRGPAQRPELLAAFCRKLFGDPDHA